MHQRTYYDMDMKESKTEDVIEWTCSGSVQIWSHNPAVRITGTYRRVPQESYPEVVLRLPVPVPGTFRSKIRFNAQWTHDWTKEWRRQWRASLATVTYDLDITIGGQTVRYVKKEDMPAEQYRIEIFGPAGPSERGALSA
ncbi:hypothetical protein TREMEDRAFT_65601 [Tremella mesenterica DSM 1558]|uniref:uncharacterized protein n=1 Tax=Tremella mesenterica (strain ATCC 24925 / CBS 8224 / DSM 1558 / NBRC 9311 / NRRL Y-6157 / RJB 2259-6 / UBC 559-6) TaxID=578456 RepID=UPI00032C48C7|nr:uncharacterized protein TREMEDRAFT_65601 [Tremella mesenterica DSM 1558]EIW66329.1 hypothetical protein TREMEDRAFT_65601 [Tremella mesenterica DSM 1558]